MGPADENVQAAAAEDASTSTTAARTLSTDNSHEGLSSTQEDSRKRQRISDGASRLDVSSSANTNTEETQQSEADDCEDGSSDTEELRHEKWRAEKALLKKYGCSNAEGIWKAFDQNSSRFNLQDKGMLRLLQRGWRASENANDIRAPELQTLEEASAQQTAGNALLISTSYPFICWRRRMQSGAKGEIHVEEWPNWAEGEKEEQREAEERMKKEK
ncbi:hypothetical protein KC356_g1947 [Hortaea werneckii]|nr:hypothetical protein KC356_g1947 [Hortaea werneckii]